MLWLHGRIGKQLRRCSCLIFICRCTTVLFYRPFFQPATLNQSALIIFVRNPELGKVKTRIAETAGNEKALCIYTTLLQHTVLITQLLHADKFVFYADYLNENDGWNNDNYRKRVQQGNSLGDKMNHAFESVFTEGYTAVCIIGSDCISLSKEIIENAFHQLEGADVVIGPSTDGGYYLLGMKQLHKTLFENKQWSTNEILPSTISSLKQLSLSYRLLQRLTDIDTEEDWFQFQQSGV